MKKFLSIVASLTVTYLNAQVLNYNLNNWKLNIPASTTKAGIIYMPMAINYSNLEQTLGDDNNLTIYTIATSSKYVESLIGVRMLPKVIINNNSIKYELITYDNNGNKKEQYFNTFKEFNSTIANMNIPNNKSWFINSYIGYMDKIHKNGVYYVKSPKGFNFTIGFNINNANTIGNNLETNTNSANNTGTNTNNAIVYPPTPEINSNSNVMTPPSAMKDQ